MASEKKEGPLPPRRDHKITLPKAIEFVKRYQRSSPASEKGGFFWADPVRKLLSQPGVVGLRYYHGVDEEGRYRIVLVGVDQDGEDIVRQVVGGGPPAKGSGGKIAKTAKTASGGGEAILLQEHFPCPPFCPPNGPLA